MAKRKFTKEEIAQLIEDFYANLDDCVKDESYGTEQEAFEQFKDQLINYIKNDN